jgi:hypothetical protein
MPGRAIAVLLLALLGAGPVAAESFSRVAWPDTDFGRALVPLEEIEAGGPPKDGIPAIDEPRFVSLAEAGDLDPVEAVIGLAIGEDARAYPLRVLVWHEIVNDTVGGVPVAVTFCPLCNAAIAFRREAAGRVLDFGTTGLLRRSDLVMYDRQTESWWQQFEGRAIVGELAGSHLEMLPARLESFASFAARFPAGRVLVPSDPGARPYGRNPYPGYDRMAAPFLYSGPMPEGIAPMARVVAVGDEAWSLAGLRGAGRIEAGDLVLTWEPGQASALDAATVAGGADVGNVVVRRKVGDELIDVVHHVTFAFVFHAFVPEGDLHVQ